MKKVLFGLALAAIVSLSSCGGGAPKVEVLSQDLQFCESVVGYGDGVLIANFGSTQLDPLNSEGRGYINYYANGEMQSFIAADGILNAPKGMLVVDDDLYIADVGKVVVYSLDSLSAAPQIVLFPDGDAYVNHLVQVEDEIFVSVTNSGNIYRFDIEDIASATPVLYTNIPGANGLLYDASTSDLYIASYPADGVTTSQNVIYKIEDIDNPAPVAVTSRTGQYDGLAMVGEDLYFTDWQGGALGRLDLVSGEVEILNTDMPIAGPAEFDIVDGKIAVPDLVNSVVYLFNI